LTHEKKPGPNVDFETSIMTSRRILLNALPRSTGDITDEVEVNLCLKFNDSY
jgi:hypothetical protein